MPQTCAAVASRRRENETHRQAVEAAIQVMRREYGDEALDLTALAEAARFSPWHFNRMFRQVTGVTPRQFLAAVRMAESKKLLCSTGMNATDVCFEVGYNSLGTFTTRFTRSVGVPPRRLRALSRTSLSRWVDRLAHMRKSVPGGPGMIEGKVNAPESFAGVIFVGLFPERVPLGKPAACAIAGERGTYRIDTVPDGRYHLLAAALPWPGMGQEWWLADEVLRGAGEQPLVVQRGKVQGTVDVTLRPPQATDPPIVVCLPILLMEWLSQAAEAEISRAI